MPVTLLSENMRGDTEGSVQCLTDQRELLLEQHLLFMEPSLGMLLLRNSDSPPPPATVHAFNVTCTPKEQSSTPKRGCLKIPRRSVFGPSEVSVRPALLASWPH